MARQKKQIQADDGLSDADIADFIRQANETDKTTPDMEDVEDAPIKKRGGKPAKKETSGPIEILPIRTDTMRVQIRGTAPLVMHAWSEKAKNMMQDKQEGKPMPKKEKRNPVEDFLGCFYTLDGKLPVFKREGDSVIAVHKAGFGILTRALWGAMQGATSYVSGVSKRDIAGVVRVCRDVAVEGDSLVKIEHKAPPIMKRDVVRIGRWPNKVADLRFRPYFMDWGATLQIEYDPDIFKPASLVNLLNRAGRCIGIGEWRPGAKENPGEYGTFEVVGQVQYTVKER